MMHKRHKQNNCLIFQQYLPSHQHICSMGQKRPSFQSNRILDTCCQDTTLWPAWPYHRHKTSFYKDDSSDVETGTSRWVPGLLSKVVETAVQLRYPWLYSSSNLRHVRRWIVVQQQWTSGQHSLRFSVTAWSSFFFSSSPNHRSRVQSWLSYVEGNPPAAHFCNPRKMCPWLFHPMAECKTSWVALNWRASTAWTTVWWQDPSDEFLVHRQLQCGTKCCLS